MSSSPVNPPDPDVVRFGLSRAIQLHSEEYRTANPQIQLDLDLVEDENLLSQGTCLALYRVYLERLQQIARAAQAGHISIHYFPSRTHMVMDIKDDSSAGASPDNIARMEACVDAAGGQLLVSAQPDSGTKITAKVPFPQ